MTAARSAPPATNTVAADDRLFATFAYTGEGAGGAEDKLAANILAYTDDAIIYLETVPKSLRGARIIRTANRDRNYWANDYIVATAARDLELFVAHDAAAPQPGWLKSFSPTGDAVKVKGRSLKLYSQPLLAGASLRISGNVDQGKNVGAALNFILFARPAKRL
jgi:beta-galactosidase